MKSRTFVYLLRNQYAVVLDQWPKSMRFATTLLSERQVVQMWQMAEEMAQNLNQALGSEHIPSAYLRCMSHGFWRMARPTLRNVYLYGLTSVSERL